MILATQKTFAFLRLPLTLICLFLILLSSFPVLAETSTQSVNEKPNISDEEREFGKTFLRLTSKFGFTEYAYAAKATNGSFIFEYLKPGADLNIWEELSTINLYPVGQTMDDGNKHVDSIATLFQKKVSEQIIEKNKYDAYFGPVYYTYYNIGTGPLKENNLSAIWQIIPGVIGVFQIQKRGEPHSAESVQQFKDFVVSMTTKNR
jgi:hypothetical protein